MEAAPAGARSSRRRGGGGGGRCVYTLNRHRVVYFFLTLVLGGKGGPEWSCYSAPCVSLFLGALLLGGGGRGGGRRRGHRKGPPARGRLQLRPAPPLEWRSPHRVGVPRRRSPRGLRPVLWRAVNRRAVNRRAVNRRAVNTTRPLAPSPPAPREAARARRLSLIAVLLVQACSPPAPRAASTPTQPPACRTQRLAPRHARGTSSSARPCERRLFTAGPL